ncbi:MAG: MAPEG family protein [Hyphomicrobiaceae bacterium]
MPITTLYAALLTPLLVVLIFRVVGARRSGSVEIGDGGDRALLRRMRCHANFVETVPMALILMGLAESLKAPAPVLHAIGAALLVGRIVHAYALAQEPHILRLRIAGMVLTLTAITLAAGVGLIRALAAGALRPFV